MHDNDKINKLETYSDILLVARLEKKNNGRVKKTILCQRCNISRNHLNRNLLEMEKVGLIDLITNAPTIKGLAYIGCVAKPRRVISKFRMDYLSD